MAKRFSEAFEVGKLQGVNGLSVRKIEVESGEVCMLVNYSKPGMADKQFFYSLPDDNGSKLRKKLADIGIYPAGEGHKDIAGDIRLIAMNKDFIEVEKKNSFNTELLRKYLEETENNRAFIWKRQLLVLHSLSAPLNEVYNCYSQRYNPVIMVVGKSSTGKSSACRYIQSLSCDVRDSKYTTDMTDTRIATIQRMAEIKGYPTLLDDTSNRSNRDFETLIYNISTGKEKERAGKKNNNYEVIGGRAFDTNVTITGEVNPLLGVKTNGGLNGRLIILNVYPSELTDSASHSRQLSCESVHYGNNSLRDEIVRCITRDGRQAVFEKMSVLTEEKSTGLGSAILDRWSRYFAVLEQTAKYLNEITGIEINMAAIESHCCEIVSRRIAMTESLGTEELFNDFYEQAVERCDSRTTNIEHYGITAKAFREILDNLRNDYLDIKPKWLKQALYEEGLLEDIKSKVVADGGTSAVDRHYFVIRKPGDDRKSISLEALNREIAEQEADGNE